ncbi:hypothetical protein CMI37_27385 [Candidatus Pacearchaeota archaeon]|nr:hypothetical protein [Candidatus Pacearchaeota archaeon]|tara:strand:- start:2353 stop:3207 length:855 start_codon:yes stop_codon:yes gene_type:complete
MTSAIVDAILGTLAGIEPSSFQTALHNPNTDRSQNTSRFQIGFDGTLTGLTVVSTSGSPDNDVYVSVTLEDDQRQERGVLFRGYMSQQSNPSGAGAKPVLPTWRLRIDSWSSMGTAPDLILRGTFLSKKRQAGGWNGTDEAPLEGKGKLRLFIGAAPAAGSNASDETPTGARWILHAYTNVLVTAAGGAARTYKNIADNVALGKYYKQISGSTQAASNTYSYIGWSGAILDTAPDTNNELSVPIPTGGMIMNEGDRIRTAIGGLGGSDQLNEPLIQVVEWLKAV